MSMFGGGPYRTAEEVPVPAPVKVEFHVTLWFEGRRPTSLPDRTTMAIHLEEVIANHRLNCEQLADWKVLAEDVSVAQTSVEPTKMPSTGKSIG